VVVVYISGFFPQLLFKTMIREFFAIFFVRVYLMKIHIHRIVCIQYIL